MGATDPLFEWYLIEDRATCKPRQRVVLIGDGKIILSTQSQDFLNSWKSPLRILAMEVPIAFGIFAAVIFITLLLRDVLPGDIGLWIMMGAGGGIWLALMFRLSPLFKGSNQLGIQWSDLTRLRTAGKSLQDALDFMRQHEFTVREFAPADFSDMIVEGKMSKRMTSARASIDWFVSGNMVKKIQAQLDS